MQNVRKSYVIYRLILRSISTFGKNSKPLLDRNNERMSNIDLYACKSSASRDRDTKANGNEKLKQINGKTVNQGCFYHFLNL